MKKAFTLFEIVVVIIVIGIMAAFVAPKFSRDDLRLAADQIATHIRYTQHLAMIDDKYDPGNADWYRGRWQIYFNTFEGKQTYTIFSDQPTYSGNPDAKEIAKNPSNSSQYLTIGHSGISGIKPTPELDLTTKYNIEAIKLSCGRSNNSRIFFDELGRPYAGNQKDKALSYMYDEMPLKEQCTITLAHKNHSTCTINVEPETGYVTIRDCGSN
ncbi:pilus assembly FimT family protein [Campylobacter hyointestinalis]|uniref:pilus assembly FimT family protein n=1 Tax=Campylobacter hyointestinalis TaxID=198 RepID=UPI002557BE5B|nr:prepilin-type N-terminal cleavage/methylation domain-containing protein [Campylobacter hyointestinalis]MDL2351084.1 prepilin-type N-terminal cleavage/methylation domain-containing protein [Campylobacter hyointestinalis]MDM1028653.1 prepilin-type N-terminal cleavage/methylation domain-containing protein [Campylobacter hyointestinalis]